MNSYHYDIPNGNQQADLVYKALGDRAISLTFLPPLIQTVEKAPLYLVIPGGGWHHETRASMLEFSSQSIETLRNHGFAVASIDYRVSSEPGITMRHIINDCFDALRYLVHFADTLSIDPHKIATSGHSAGGHLALMLAYAPQEAFRQDAIFDDFFTIRAVAPMSPPTILATHGFPVTHALHDLANNFSGCDTEEERMSTSPVHYVRANCPPTFLTAGTSDRLVFSNASELLHARLLEAGADSRLMLSLGGGHCFEPMHPSISPLPDAETIQGEIAQFILKKI